MTPFAVAAMLSVLRRESTALNGQSERLRIVGTGAAGTTGARVDCELEACIYDIPIFYLLVTYLTRQTVFMYSII